MGKPLHVLIVEDSASDAGLVLRELARGGYATSHERVDTMQALAAALDAPSWDAIICDWSLPELSGMQVLSLVKQRGLDLPFLIVSGVIDEDDAVDALKAGAHDFLNKARLSRLSRAIEREIREAATRAERRKTQEQMLLSDRLASLGTLAAGVAHEINNPLMALLANLELIGRELEAVTKGATLGASRRPESAMVPVACIRDNVQDAREAGERIRRIVRDLSIFLRSEDEAHGPADIHRVLESALRIASIEIRQRAQLVRHYGDVPPVAGSEARLGQVFVNLVVNAAQAIPDNCNGRQHEIRIATRTHESGCVAVDVTDTGCGIAPEHLSRIFDPFFTTKPVGMGTGLGLAVSHRIVSALGGEIRVTTRVGEGTTFCVLLPVATKPVNVAREVLRARHSLPSTVRRARILVVDDEATIVGAIKGMLSVRHDVTVETRADPVLQRLRAGERYDVILCDLMMPEIDGMQLYETLLPELPQQANRMVFITGGAFSERARRFLEEVPNPRIEKPFTSQRILNLINAWVG
jgi:signal transduction histidine kinase